MAKVIDVTISINGKKINRFLNLTLNQSINVHHSFELLVPFDFINDKTNLVINDSIKFVGKPISLGLYAKDTSNGTEFEGVVTSVQHHKSSSNLNSILISGYGKTIHLDGSLDTKAFTELKLSDIIGNCSKAFGSKVKVNCKPNFTAKIPYTAQHQETDFAFMRRLAADYGESFYYDGKVLQIGKFEKGKSISAVYPKDLTDLAFNLNVHALHNNFINYDQEQNKLEEYESKSGDLTGISSLGNEIKKDVFGFYAKSNTVNTLYPAQGLKTVAKRITEINSARLSTLVASGDDPNIGIAKVVNVKIKAKKDSDEAGDGDYGGFIVTSVRHQVDGIGNYSSTFEGISQSASGLPNPYNQYVPASNQIAEVTDIKDPDKHGRIKVKFKWMPDGESTFWVRLVTNYSGSDKGMMFMPEVGDEVIVGFESGNPSYPIVVGSLYNGKDKLLKKFELLADSKVTINQDFEKNDIKQIVTRSGNKIVLSDVDGKEQILISTAKDENGIAISVEKDLIQIHAKKKIEITSEEIDIHAKKDINIKSDQGAINMTTLKGDISLNSKSNIDVVATKNVKAKGNMNANVEAGTNLTLKGGAKTAVEAGANLGIKGALVKVEASAINEIKGALVKIN